MRLAKLAATSGGALLLALTPAAYAQSQGGGHRASPVAPGECRAGTDHHGPRAYTVMQCDAKGNLRSRRTVQTIATTSGPRTRVTEVETQVPGEPADVHDVTHAEPFGPADPRWAKLPAVAPNVPQPQGPQRHGSPPPPEQSPGGGTAPWQERCQDTRWTYAAQGGLAGRYRPWYWYPYGTPSDVNGTGARNAAAYGHGIWEQTRNDCGFGDLTNVSMPYHGDTGGNPSRFDGWNWVGFANTANHCGTTALACATWRFNGNQVVEADIILHRATGMWALTQTSGRYDVQAVVVHEAGHAIGLHHPCGATNDAYAYCSDSLLSMSSARTNRVTQRHLGYGDAYGLWATNQ